MSSRLLTAQAFHVLRDRPMGGIFALPSRIVMSAPVSTDKGARFLAVPLRDSGCADATSEPRGGLLEFCSWSDAREREIRCNVVGPRLLGGAPKVAKRPATAVRKRPASSSAHTACIVEAPSNRKRAFKESAYCKNESCLDLHGKRRKKQTGLAGYCWTCGPLFASEATAKAKKRQSQVMASASSAWCAKYQNKYAPKVYPCT